MAPLLLIGALPLIALALNPNLFFSPLDFVDPWVYLGYFHHLKEFSGSLFKGLYFANRLSWLLPGTLFFKVLSPLVANYALRLAVAYTALFSLYFALRRLASEGLALAAAVTLAANPFFWQAVGEDYVDGFGVALYLLLAALLSRTRITPTVCVVVGALWVALVDSNLVWAGFTPALLLLYFRNPREAWKSDLRYAIAGALALAAVLSIASHLLWNDWWFYRSSLSFASGSLSRQSSYKRPGYAWMLHAPWLASLALSIAVSPWRRGIRTWQFWACLAPIAAVELPGLYFLDYPFYASFLMPAIVLAYASRWEIAAALALNVGLFAMQPARLTPSAHDSYARITQAMQQVDQARGARRPLFWYNAKEPNAAELDALSSVYLWVYSSIGRDFPERPNTEKLAAGKLLVIASSRPDAMEAARRSLAPLGFDLREEGSAKQLHFAEVVASR